MSPIPSVGKANNYFQQMPEVLRGPSVPQRAGAAQKDR